MRVLLASAAGLLCALVALGVYANTLECGICFDDEPTVKKNKDLRPETPWRALLSHDFWGAPMSSPNSHKSYRPLVVATFRLNYLVHGLQPMGYHLVNVLLHGAVCFLYAVLCAAVFGGVGPALLAGLLFAVHPIHTEAVAGLVGRAELLGAVFFIGAILSYRHAAVQERGLKWLCLTCVLALCSALSKEQGLTVVAVCLLDDLCLLQKVNFHSGLCLVRDSVTNPRAVPPWLWRFVRRAALLGVFTVVFLVLRVWIMQGRPLIFFHTVNPPLALETPYRQLSWLYLCFVNTYLLLNPFTLCADWRYGAVPLIHSLFDPLNLLTIVTLAAFACLTVYSVTGNGKSRKMMLFGLSLMVLPFIPASNLFFPIGFVVAERVLYLPSMGFCALVGYGVWHLSKLSNNPCYKTLAWTLTLSLLLLFSLRTVARNRDWQSNFSVYTSGVQCNPNNGAMLTNLGIEYAHRKNYTFAEFLYRRATKVAPKHSKGPANLGGLLEALKRYDEAEEALREAVRRSRSDEAPATVLDTYMFLIEKVIMRNESRLQDALATCDEALSLLPTYAKLYSAKGVILLKMNRTSEALPLLMTAVESGLEAANTYHHLGLALLQSGKAREAEAAQRKALGLDGGHVRAMVALGDLLSQSSGPARREEAKQVYRQALATDSRDTEALLQLGRLLYTDKSYNDARVVFERLVHLQPYNKELLYHLGKLFYMAKQFPKASDYFKRVVNIDPNYLDAGVLLKKIRK